MISKSHQNHRMVKSLTASNRKGAIMVAGGSAVVVALQVGFREVLVLKSNKTSMDSGQISLRPHTSFHPQMVAKSKGNGTPYFRET